MLKCLDGPQEPTPSIENADRLPFLSRQVHQFTLTSRDGGEHIGGGPDSRLGEYPCDAGGHIAARQPSGSFCGVLHP